ncbi:YafY family protein [Ochrobactrum vermis]|uniref:YafY family protein n=1 Tax=Ochrobactrum vermis TaxID=1827297 RepID=A0ABU8PF86_9HYPH|nr:YafY family protein [Ochrobactrum vermis]PQZ25310.1 transcriptional regulator [Ochrobactrum vermis]
MQRSGRILRLLQVLRERRTAVTAQMLSTLFGVSERTIYRDMQTLVELGVLVEGEAGIGFILRPGFFFPPMALSQIEADAVLLGLRLVSMRRDESIVAAADTALAKIADGMGDAVAAEMRSNGLTVGPSGSGKLTELATVRAAMRNQKKLLIKCGAGEEGTLNRTVWPVALSCFDQAEILAAWCETRDAFRHFRIDRIVERQELPDPLPRPRRSLLAEYRLMEPQANL